MATSISSEDLERLAKRITDLDRTSEQLRVWLYIWTAVVAIGLILEYRKDFVRLVELFWVYAVRRVPFEWWRIRKALITLFAGGLVTVGVVGELWIEFQRSGVETELEKNNGKLTGDLGQVAKEAADNAHDALHDASAAMTEVGTVGPKAQAAELASVRALEKSNNAEKSASNATSLADGAKKQVSDVLTFLTPRSLTPQEKDELRDAFKPLADPAVPILVLGSAESGLFVQVWNSLKEAGFDKAEVRQVTNTSYGMSMSAPLRYMNLSERIAKVLLDARIGPMMGLTGRAADTDPVTIFIGDIRTAPLPPLTGKTPK